MFWVLGAGCKTVFEAEAFVAEATFGRSTRTTIMITIGGAFTVVGPRL